MSQAVATLLIVVLMLTLRQAEWLRDLGGPLTPSTMTVGFILLIAYMAGKAVFRFKLPRITGYMVVGIVVGPYVFGLISHEMTHQLQLINGLALSFIALTAGGELRLRELRPVWKSLCTVTLAQTIVLWFVFVGFVCLAHPVAGQNHPDSLPKIESSIGQGEADSRLVYIIFPIRYQNANAHFLLLLNLSCSQKKAKPTYEEGEAAQGRDHAEFLDTGDAEQVETPRKKQDPQEEPPAGVLDERFGGLQRRKPAQTKEGQPVNQMVQDARLIHGFPCRGKLQRMRTEGAKGYSEEHED